MAEELSEEDQQLKNDLDMLSERILVRGYSDMHLSYLRPFARIDFFRPGIR